MIKIIVLSLLFICGCTKPLTFHYGDVVSWKVSPGGEFDFKNCKDNLGTITSYLKLGFIHETEYFVDVGSKECSFWMKESNLVKEGISVL